MNDLQSREDHPVGFRVYDADSNQHVTVTAEMQVEAFRAMQQITAGTVVIALNIRKIKDNRLYLAIQNARGKYYHSWREFVEGELTKVGIGYATSYRYYRVAEAFETLLDRQFLNDNEGSSRNVATVNSLPISKLEELTRFPRDQVHNLSESDELILADGRVLTLKDLLSMSYKELVNERNAYHQQAEEATEKAALAEEQLGAANERLQKLATEEAAARMVVQLQSRLEELEGRVIAIGEADKHWQEVDHLLENAARLARSIPPTGDNDKELKYRRLLSSYIEVLSNVLVERGWTYLDPREVFGAIPDELPERDRTKFRSPLSDQPWTNLDPGQGSESTPDESTTDEGR